MYSHLNEDLLLEMAEIGRIYGYKINIYIYGSEGPIPHFHVENKEKNIKSCVCILEDKYFKHRIYKDGLDSKLVKWLKLFLSSPHKFFGKHGYTNWQIICAYWNDNNPDYMIKEGLDALRMPLYNNLNIGEKLMLKPQTSYMVRNDGKIFD